MVSDCPEVVRIKRFLAGRPQYHGQYVRRKNFSILLCQDVLHDEFFACSCIDLQGDVVDLKTEDLRDEQPALSPIQSQIAETFAALERRDDPNLLEAFARTADIVLRAEGLNNLKTLWWSKHIASKFATHVEHAPDHLKELCDLGGKLISEELLSGTSKVPMLTSCLLRLLKLQHGLEHLYDITLAPSFKTDMDSFRVHYFEEALERLVERDFDEAEGVIVDGIARMNLFWLVREEGGSPELAMTFFPIK